MLPIDCIIEKGLILRISACYSDSAAADDAWISDLQSAKCAETT